MNVAKIKEMLCAYDVERVYLVKEGKFYVLILFIEERKKKFREKMGGKKGVLRFTEGWIEFSDKKVARMVALSINNTKMSNLNYLDKKKGTFYSEDTWCIKYLPKFKWENLTEKLAYDARMRKEKLTAEVKKENKKKDYYL